MKTWGKAGCYFKMKPVIAMSLEPYLIHEYFVDNVKNTWTRSNGGYRKDETTDRTRFLRRQEKNDPVPTWSSQPWRGRVNLFL